jgi:hypothetical protein
MLFFQCSILDDALAVEATCGFRPVSRDTRPPHPKKISTVVFVTFESNSLLSRGKKPVALVCGPGVATDDVPPKALGREG